jgi:polar amino acid transport system substrate-binding protein
MRRTRRAVAALAALALAATACGGDDATDEDDGADEQATADTDLDLVADDTLTVCSDVPYEPFEFEDADAPSGYSGFDIDLMQAIADDLGVDLEVRAVAFESITSGAAMAGGDCDVAASAITITEEREEALDFSEPYYDSLQSLLVPEGAGIDSLEDTDGARIGVQSGTTGEAYTDDNAPEGAEIVRFEGTGDLFSALDADSVDAILQDLPVNAERARTTDGLDVVETYETGEAYGFAFESGREDGLPDAVDDSLNTLRDEGTYDELYDQYFATE